MNQSYAGKWQLYPDDDEISEDYLGKFTVPCPNIVLPKWSLRDLISNDYENALRLDKQARKLQATLVRDYDLLSH